LVLDADEVEPRSVGRPRYARCPVRRVRERLDARSELELSAVIAHFLPLANDRNRDDAMLDHHACGEMGLAIETHRSLTDGPAVRMKGVGIDAPAHDAARHDADQLGVEV